MSQTPHPPTKVGATPAVTRYFDSRAAGYCAAMTHGPWSWLRHRESSAVLALAGPVSHRAVLDLGCGAGAYATLFADNGAAPVVGVDASRQMIAAIADHRIATIVGDVATVSLDRRFDLVVLAGVLEFVADAGAVLANAARHLTTDGRIVALVPPDTLGGWTYRLFHRSHGIAITLFSEDQIALLADGAGLRPTARRLVRPYAAVYALEPR
ncbi:class I SAM-dependent methyltransferase [Telmatospirillum sp.]|uniref:class I SAM-dependent methyltransferase n=1 Tax=Telmatospirillum sp. TaxID=2079197 RepID=UPI00284D1382|nr:class I SAM-dependent methyltransferase [Telmatospirillum sp.]MDR3437108.1 class I SAM-dependent methyltransferase [Telmatospirillum sp.]